LYPSLFPAVHYREIPFWRPLAQVALALLDSRAIYFRRTTPVHFN
jgi:hypothetical protein